MVSAIGVAWWYESPVCHRSFCDEDNAMKTRVALLFVILSLLATPTYGVDFKKVSAAAGSWRLMVVGGVHRTIPVNAKRR